MFEINLEEYELRNGSHESREKGMCAMEFVAYLANEPHGDKPNCASPLITSFVISCNDNWTVEERQLLKPYLPRIMGTRDGKDVQRAKIFAMHAITKITPHAIELIGLKDEAEKMRNAKTLNEGILAAKSAFGNDALDGFEYKGFTYRYDLECSKDNCKTYHMAHAAGSDPRLDRHFDWSPYSNPTKEDFMLWVDLDMPERIGFGPLNRSDLDRIKAEGLKTYRCLITLINGFGEEVERTVRITTTTYQGAKTQIESSWPEAKIVHLQQDRWLVNHT